MKLRKLTALFAAVACTAALCAPVLAATIDLGAPTVVNNDTQKGWSTNGVDGITTKFSAEDFNTATTLTLEFASAPVGGMQLIWQGDADNWAWNQKDGVIPDNGTSETKLVIDLPSTLKNYDAFTKSSQIKIFLGYYSNGFDDLQITKATLSGGGAAPAAAAASGNPDTGEGVIIYLSAAMVLLASCSAFFFYRKTKQD